MSFCLIAAFCVAIVGMITSFAISWTKSRRTLVTVRMDVEDEHGITRSITKEIPSAVAKSLFAKT